VSVIGPDGSVVLPLIADESVPRGVLWAPFNQPGASVNAIVSTGRGVTDVKIERLA